MKTHVIWLTGVSGAGKTTLGNLLKIEFAKRKKPVEMLDGDIVREFFGNDLGYSRKERIFNIKRIVFCAKLLSDHGINVVVANIAPYYEIRDFIRKKIENYIQIYIKVSLENVKLRDPKGLYKAIVNGQSGPMIGVDDQYDVPRNPHLIIDTNIDEIDTSFKKILAFLESKNILGKES